MRTPRPAHRFTRKHVDCAVGVPGYPARMTEILPEPPEVAELERTAAWRLRLVDADPSDIASRAAAARLQELADDLRDVDSLGPLWTELRSLSNWLAESDAISDYAELAAAYRARIGVAEHPENGGAYLRALLAIANSLV
jgi:hypothetical protein